MLYNRCTGIYKFGNNTYPQRIRRRSNLGHIFRGKKCVLWTGKNVVRKRTISRSASTNDNLSAVIRVMWPAKIICLFTSRDPGPLECSAMSIEKKIGARF